MKNLTKIYLIRAGLPILKIYWQIFKPHTFGAKVLIINNDDDQKVLLVKHSYGDRNVWSLPGGGYNPKHETAEAAAIREIKEELNINLDDLNLISERKTESEGKRDTVSLFSAHMNSKSEIKNTYEIAAVEWQHYRNAFNNPEVDQMVKDAIETSFQI